MIDMQAAVSRTFGRAGLPRHTIGDVVEALAVRSVHIDVDPLDVDTAAAMRRKLAAALARIATVRGGSADAGELASVAAIAAAAVAFVSARGVPGMAPWWAVFTSAIHSSHAWYCVGCQATSKEPNRVRHADDCPALALDTAIRAMCEAAGAGGGGA